MEPRGAVKAAGKNPDVSSMSGFAASIIPYIVYPSIIILACIIIGIILKKYWAYITAFIFSVIHLVLIIILVIFQVNSGFGPWVVIPANTGMIIFSCLLIRNIKKNVTGKAVH
jgi:hypothetical protein